MAHYMELPENFEIYYSIVSPLGEIENYRYRQRIIGDIWVVDDGNNKVRQIGLIQADKMLIIPGYENEWSAINVYDTEEYLMELGETIFNFKEQDFVKELDEFYQHDLYDRNILFLDSIEIISDYRGYKLGEHSIKDLANNFLDGCGLFVVDASPPQHSPTKNRPSDKLKELMRYDLFENDPEAAKYKLINYLKRTGFDYIPELTEDYMFINPVKRNVNFDYIELL